MKNAMLAGADLLGLEEAAGPTSYARGLAYARKHAVITMRWDEAASAVRGRVQGSYGEAYTTTAYFASGYGPALAFAEGECSCPVALDCKHVVALVLTAAGLVGAPRAAPAKPKPLTWEQSLDALLAPGPVSAGSTPLAIELTLSANGLVPGVFARVVRPSRSGWAGGGLSWTRLANHRGEYVDEHLRLLQELYALYRSSSRSYDEHSIELSGFDSTRLWSVLDDADAMGLRLVHARKRLGDIVRTGPAQLFLDATRTERKLVLGPALRVEGMLGDPVPVSFVGDHGVVYVDRAELQADHREWRLGLTRLTEAVPEQLRRLAVDNRRLEIPVAEQPKFATEYFPRLRRLAPVVSSDESFSPPTISEPTLMLHASYGDGHRLSLRWEWMYEVDGRQSLARTGRAGRRLPGRGGGADRVGGPRRRAVGAVRAPVQRIALARRGARHRHDAVHHRGAAAARRPARAWPVEIDGETAEYREVGDSLTIGVSTSEVPGDTDWFDLGVTIKAEGREVPFLDVFLALAREQSHLLLPDGAYFSLEKPELLALRRLIEEARSLQESSDGTLRISRYQAGAVGRAGAARRGGAAGGGVGAAGQRAAVDRVGAPGRGAGGAHRTAASLPGGRLPLAGVPVGAPARRHPGRRHGAGQDAAVAGADLPRRCVRRRS